MAWQAKVLIHNGRSVPFEEARIHPLSVVAAYGVGVFEGIRAYRNPATGRFFVFRLEEHLARIGQGMKIMRFDDPPPLATLREGVLRAVRENAPDEDAYIRLQVQIEAIGSQASTGPTSWFCACVPRERSAKYASGLSLGVSSWVRIADGAMPPRVKATANYHAGRLAGLQARADGYDMAVILNHLGKVSETPGACLFLVRDGRLVTPSRQSDILESVTRDTVLTLAGEMGLAAEERLVDRTELYVAEEAFICGTGQELQPVVAVDRLPVGDGKPGAITMRLQAAYESVVRGTTDAHAEWRTPVAA
jgi:branched-chain amino acid aminotransferase